MRLSLALTSLLFAAAVAGEALAHAQKLEGTEWGVVGEHGAKARYVSFAGSGRLFGFGGCNRFSATYEQHDHHVVITGIAATRMACEADAMQKESQFFEMLGKVRAVEVDHTLMLLLDETGGNLQAMSLRNAPSSESSDESQ